MRVTPDIARGVRVVFFNSYRPADADLVTGDAVLRSPLNFDVLDGRQSLHIHLRSRDDGLALIAAIQRVLDAELVAARE